MSEIALQNVKPTAQSGAIRPILRPYHKQFVCQCFAEFKTTNEIVDLLKSEYGLSVPYPTVYYYWLNPTWRKRIMELRAQLEEQIRERLPIASKFWRLQELENMYREEGKLRIGGKGGPRKRAAEARETLKLAAQELGDLRHVIDMAATHNVVHEVQLAGGQSLPPASTSRLVAHEAEQDADAGTETLEVRPVSDGEQAG